MKKRLGFLLFFVFVLAKSNAQNACYYLSKANIEDSVSIKNYIKELGSRLLKDTYVAVDFSAKPVICHGANLNNCIADQISKANAGIATDSMALAMMVNQVNQLITPINNIDFYFFISAKSLENNFLNQFISKLLLTTNLYTAPNTSIYLLVKDQQLIPQLAFLKSNKNYAQFQIKLY